MIISSALQSTRRLALKKRLTFYRPRRRFLRLAAAYTKSHPLIHRGQSPNRLRKFPRHLVRATPKSKALAFDDDDYYESEDDRILTPVEVETSARDRNDGRRDKSESDAVANDEESSGNSVLYDLLFEIDRGMPKSWYHKALWLWERPVMKLGRLTVFFAQLPVVFTFLSSQIGFLVGQITLPMLPPLLLGAGILLRSIWANAGHLFPRVSLTMLLLWGIWFLNSLIFRTISYLTKQGTVSRSTAHAIMNWTEGLTLVTAGLVMLSLFGVNISGLLLPAGICLALAAKDLTHNFIAGIVLFLAQPFRVGDSVSVQPTQQKGQRWYEGTCERIDLRYTVLRKGRYKLHIPNASFITKEFMVMDRAHDHAEEKRAHPLGRDEDHVDMHLQKDRDMGEEARTNGSSLDLEDMPSAVDYPPRELHIGDLTDLVSDS